MKYFPDFFFQLWLLLVLPLLETVSLLSFTDLAVFWRSLKTFRKDVNPCNGHRNLLAGFSLLSVVPYQQTCRKSERIPTGLSDQTPQTRNHCCLKNAFKNNYFFKSPHYYYLNSLQSITLTRQVLSMTSPEHVSFSEYPILPMLIAHPRGGEMRGI